MYVLHFSLQKTCFFYDHQYFFYILRSIFIRFFAFSLAVIQYLSKFQRILTEGLNALFLRYETCMFAKIKKSNQKGHFSPKRKKKTFFVVVRLRSTKLKLGLHIYIGQVKFDFELIRTKKKICFFCENLIKIFHTYYFFYNFFKMLIFRHQYNSNNI